MDRKIVDLSPRQAEFATGMRDAINMLSVKYSDVFSTDAILGMALEMYAICGADRQDVHALVDELWQRIEELLENLDENLAAIDAAAGVGKKN